MLSHPRSQGKHSQGSLTERGRINTADLLVLTTLVQLLSVLKILFTFFTIQATLMRIEEVNCTYPPSVSIPWHRLLALDQKSSDFS
jgi:hypothetical protein